MNKLTATELKRRGLEAVEKQLRHGPVHLTKKGKPIAVVLTEDQFARLVERAAPKARPLRETDLSDLLRRQRAGSEP